MISLKKNYPTHNLLRCRPHKLPSDFAGLLLSPKMQFEKWSERQTSSSFDSYNAITVFRESSVLANKQITIDSIKDAFYAFPKTVHDIFMDIQSPDLGDKRIKNPKATHLLLALRFLKKYPTKFDLAGIGDSNEKKRRHCSVFGSTLKQSKFSRKRRYGLPWLCSVVVLLIILTSIRS